MSLKKQWNRVYERPDNLVESFESAVRRFPDNRFIGTKGLSGNYNWSTYSMIGERVDAVRSGLALLGIGKGDTVGVISSNSEDWAVCSFAVYGLGAVYVPMYEKEKFTVWEYTVMDSGLKVLFVSDDIIYEKVKKFIDDMPSLERIIIFNSSSANSLSELEKAGRENPTGSIYPSFDDTAVIIYTSGTTGEPKGVMLTHGNCTSNSRAGWRRFSELDERAVSFSHLPWAHSYGLSAELNCWIQFGGAIGLMESLEHIQHDMQKVRPTFLLSVPRVFDKIYSKVIDTINSGTAVKRFMFHRAMRAARKKRITGKSGPWFKIMDRLVLSRIREIFGGQLEGSITASARMNPRVADFFFDLGIPVYDCYGMTEASPAATMSHSSGYRAGSVGRPLENIDIVIDRSRVKDGSDDGEILIYGPNVMKGYHNKPEKTSEMITSDGAIRTGDRGRLDKDGYLYITGRFKEEYKLSNGKYVFPAEIEEELKSLPFVSNVMVYGDGKAYNVALIVPDMEMIKKFFIDMKNSMSFKDFFNSDMFNSANIKKKIMKEITSHLGKRFAGYEIPKKIFFLDEDFTIDNGLLTQTMKLRRFNVIERYARIIEALYAEAHA